MKMIVAAFFLASPLLGQYYGPPARDLQEAQRMISDLQKQLEPAFLRARDQAETLQLVNRVERIIDEYPPNDATGRAIEAIDEFLVRRDEREAEFPRELRIVINNVRKWLDDTRLGPPQSDLSPLRERIHHEVTHSLQKQVLANARTLQSLNHAWEPMLRTTSGLLAMQLGAAEAAAPPPRKR